MKKEKYGFVYIWRDRKHARFYIGCHWGTENDGYVCSSRHMKNAYRRRPHDFKRRIIGRVYTNKVDMFDLEYKWLSLIKPEELGKRYYNLHNVNKNHWSADKNKSQEVKFKINSYWTDDSRKKHGKRMIGDNNPMKDPEIAARALQRKRENNPDLGIWNRGRPVSEEQKQKQSKAMKGRVSPVKGIKSTKPPNERSGVQDYIVISEDGSTEIIKNLNEYCRINNYNSAVVRGYVHLGKPYKGKIIKKK